MKAEDIEKSLIHGPNKYYPFWERNPRMMCTCSVHCKCSPYHESACCNDREHCPCFCHEKNGRHACR